MEPAGLGIVVDSSILIAAERRGHTVRQILEQIPSSQGEIEIALSVVTIAELVHGAYRARTQEQPQVRLSFIERLCRDIPVHPVTLSVARLAGRIEAEQESRGIKLPFDDLLIATTALDLEYAVATLKRHFDRIPGLSLVRF
jgi:predicted nucleic acid-binding protein